MLLAGCDPSNRDAAVDGRNDCADRRRDFVGLGTMREMSQMMSRIGLPKRI
jgi:hypothetical protein